MVWLAKEMTGKTEYDFYLSDIRTPAMNGMQFYEYLRQEHPGQENKVIFTTGDVMSLDVKTFLSKRANLFLAKPFTPNDLRASSEKRLLPLRIQTSFISDKEIAELGPFFIHFDVMNHFSETVRNIPACLIKAIPPFRERPLGPEARTGVNQGDLLLLRSNIRPYFNSTPIFGQHQVKGFTCFYCFLLLVFILSEVWYGE